MTAKRQALVLFSGGQDSSTCLAWALERYEHVETIGFDYGQRHAVELQCRGLLRDGMKRINPHWSYKLGPDHLIDAFVINLFASFVEPLEQELGMKSTHTIGRLHNVADSQRYKNRIEAINFSLAHDDGQSAANLKDADVILVGVSRSGKTPTSLYLAMQHGLKAANYPLIPEDFERKKLPPALLAFRSKLFGLSITPERLSQVRHERRPGSQYASLNNCRYEVAEAEHMMRREGIRWLTSTSKSIEEIATTILQQLNDPTG
ncbi:MAG: pyruvate, phosphate dikinase/phosphoenolpyruvate synthase regulator [Betaproteobacteria bacterium]|nr:pyruvate, phosphate dikinase/phosphoenolpyruvate synthase regulator [Betaproteobacteria bacterium]